MEPKVLLTGATGFIGTRLGRLLEERGYSVRAALFDLKPVLTAESIVVGEIGPRTNWEPALRGIQFVVHLAARAHIMRDSTSNPLAEYRRINTAGTARLAEAAAKAGVRRMVFVSSIKVNGENTPADRPFRETDTPNPQNPYAISKWEAEKALLDISGSTRLETVIVRPTLVYGPRVRGNFLSLLGYVRCCVPLPLASVKNVRSLVGLENLCDFLARSLSHPAAAGQTFLLSDGENLSTAELIRRIAVAMHKPACLFPVSKTALGILARLAGRNTLYSRLCESLRVDPKDATRRLGWSPLSSIDAELRRTAEWYMGLSG
jgi:nucleoside-diphosphate-sugar epimerase